VDSSLKAECGTIIVSTILSDDQATAAKERHDFRDVEESLASAFGPC
jgi:hypothetical protein